MDSCLEVFVFNLSHLYHICAPIIIKENTLTQTNCWSGLLQLILYLGLSEKQFMTIF